MRTYMDIILGTNGTIEGMVGKAIETGTSITSVYEAHQVPTVDGVTDVQDQAISAYYKANAIVPATGFGATPGIGELVVQYNFDIS